MIYGYARVSTDGQTLDAQREALTAAGAARVYQEKVSGAAVDRRELGRLMASLEAGDTLLVTRLDRLARSTLELLRILERVVEAGAGFRSLADTWADTTTPQGRLVLTIMGGFAQFERDLIKARTGEGRARAKARGVKLGRRFKLSHHQRQEALQRRAQGDALADIARSYNVSHSTISRLKP